jgi:Domain of unknown function (DUF6398)
MTKSTRVPDQMRDQFDSIRKPIEAFCDQCLNDEYKELILCALAALCRKRPSPLLQGKENSWAAGVVHAVGMINFLFDKTQTPHCKSSDIYSYFGVGSSTGQGKSKEVRNLLKASQFSPEWTLPSRIEKNPLIWLVEVNGLTVDVRHMPLEVQEIAYAKGLIPFIPVKNPGT